ncbi:MAG: hypothetical protein ACLUE2_04165 [Bacteroides cellulosilyticus]
MEKADYLRLKNISIAYTIPRAKQILQISESPECSKPVYDHVLHRIYDPEGTMDITSNGGNSDINAGVDGGSYPLPRTFTLGLGFSF